jgi:hypothetical protein
MKNFTRLAVVVAIAFCALSANAQSNDWRLGIGVAPGYTTNDPSRFALGGDLRLQKGFGNSVSGILTAGFTQFFKKDLFESFGAFPVKLGLKAFPAKNFYVAAEGGVGFFTKEIKTSAVVTPSLGVIVGTNWDISLKYEYFTKEFYPKELGLRIAYGFKL